MKTKPLFLLRRSQCQFECEQFYAILLLSCCAYFFKVCMSIRFCLFTFDLKVMPCIVYPNSHVHPPCKHVHPPCKGQSRGEAQGGVRQTTIAILNLQYYLF